MNNIYNKQKKEINIHLVSDSTGETIENTVSATISQFTDVSRKEFFWPMTRTELMTTIDLYWKIVVRT